MLDLDDIQSGVLRPRPSPYAATYLIFRIDERDGGRKLLERILPVIASAAAPKSPAVDGTWVSVALTYAGLEALGVPRDTLESFSPEFRQGMAARAAVLADTGENAPERWEKPLGTRDVHVVLAAVSPDRNRLEEALARARNAYEAIRGIRAIWRQDCHALSSEREGFGFRDWNGHPAVEGSGIATTHTVDPPLRSGEVILGYPDDTGRLPPMPRPDILGRNGSYVAFRKLHQRVALFRTHLWESQMVEEAEKIIARMKGGWAVGAPLADYAEFDDPAPGHERRLARPVRLHRMLRRSTAYGPELPAGVMQDDGLDRGVMFAFIGADLRRQFEFPQSQWKDQWDFLGHDPPKEAPAEGHDGSGSYSNLRRPIQKLLRGLPRFVVTRGGEYGFLPGLRALRWLAELRS